MNDPALPLHSARSQQLEAEFRRLSGREVQMWSVGLLVMLILAAGFLVVSLPRLVWHEGDVPMDSSHLLQLIMGLFVLILIFTGYVLDQKRVQQRTRQELVREIVFSERLEAFSLVDPLTQMFNRRYLDALLPKEVSRANRLGSSLAVLLAEVKDWLRVAEKHGELAADQLLIEAAQVIKKTFRGSDTILRYDAARFLVVLPDTTEAQAACALKRLHGRVDAWNLESGAAYELSLATAVGSVAAGSDADRALNRLQRKLWESQQEWARTA